MLCWLIRAASSVKCLKVLEIVAVHIFLFDCPIIPQTCVFFTFIFHVASSCCPCNLEKLTRQEGGSAILWKENSWSRTSEVLRARLSRKGRDPPADSLNLVMRSKADSKPLKRGRMGTFCTLQALIQFRQA